MVKKCVITTMTALIVCISSVAFATTSQFSDVSESHWAYNDITNLANNGIISPYEDGTFKGNRNATRYEVAVMVANLYSKKTHTSITMGVNPFSDLPSNHWAAKSVTTLFEAGIEEGGYGDGTFLGNRNITHGELRNWLNNLFRVTGIDARMKDNPNNESEPITRYEIASTLNKVYKALFN
ncbi:MAG: S-layer homology domain-containing protein [Selenomonadaceae bacterium]|nr:S-layer homology domain-containing protein [Selenomonadaceae bacterium]